MDWSKIKTRLILILLVLNVGLGVLYIRNFAKEEPYTISRDNQEVLLGQLDDKDISIEADFPRGTQSLRPLVVRYEETSPDAISKSFFAGAGQIEENADITRVSTRDQEVTIINDRRLIYDNLSPSQMGSKTDPEDLVTNFLIDKGFSTGDMVLAKKIKSGNRIYLEYVKAYEGKLIETSYTRFELEDGIIRMMDRLWLDVIAEDKDPVEIEPAYKGLMSLLTEEDYYGTKVTSVDLCYYFNPEDQGVLDDNTKALRGRAIPAWRISFDTGQTKIVDNY